MTTIEPSKLLAYALAALGEIESGQAAASGRVRAPGAADVVAHLAAAGVDSTLEDVAAVLRVAIEDLGLATGVVGSEDGVVRDARSLHLTLAGSRWLWAAASASSPAAEEKERPHGAVDE